MTAMTGSGLTHRDAGPFEVLICGFDPGIHSNAIDVFSQALREGVFGPRAELKPVGAQSGAARFMSDAHALPAYTWPVICNLLTNAGAPPTGARIEVQAAGRIIVDRLIAVTAFELDPPSAGIEFDLSRWYEHVNDFRLEIEFAQSQNAESRDAACAALDAWAALIVHGALPDPQYPNIPSVIGGPSIRFEDPGTLVVDGEGMVCAPNAGATLLLALLQGWPDERRVTGVRFETFN